MYLKKFLFRPEFKSLVSKFIYLLIFAYVELKFFREVKVRVIFHEMWKINTLEVYIDVWLTFC